nr:hypothetical protein [uncultured Psychroserpens sp.]
MKSTQLFTTLFLFAITFSFSQDLIQTQTLVESNFGLIYSFDRSDKTIQGTPYIIDDFTPARVSADQNKIFNLRYNAVSDQMEVQSDKNTIQAINRNIEGVTITFLKDNKTYQSLNYINEDGIAERGYFIHVNSPDSKVNLLLKESKKFIERQPAKSSYQETKPARFKKVDDVYYIILKNKTAQILPEKKKDILKLFPENSDKVASFIKSNKIKVSKREHLIKLVNYINTL